MKYSFLIKLQNLFKKLNCFACKCNLNNLINLRHFNIIDHHKNNVGIFKNNFYYLYGIFLGYIIWNYIIYNIGMPNSVTYWCLNIILIVSGFGCAFSKVCRCLSLLICIGFIGKAGRSVLKAIAFALIISGPLNNLVLNGKEIVRVFTCSTILTYNLTRVRFDLMTKPFHNALLDFKNNITNVKETFKTIELIVEPVIHEIEDNDDQSLETNQKNTTIINNNLQLVNIPIIYSEIVTTTNNNNSFVTKRNINYTEKNNNNYSYEKFYKEKLKKRCELQLERGQSKCKFAFLNAYESCYNNLPIVVNTLLCWPMKISYICNFANVMSSSGNICDTSKFVDPSLHFDERYGELKQIEHQLLSNLDETHVNYTFIQKHKIAGLKSAMEISNNVYKDFMEKKKIFDYCMNFIKKILALIIIKVFINAIRYQCQYIGNIEYDNIYLTKYFYKIDERRKNRSLRNLLPLKKIERKKLIDSGKLKKHLFEYRQLIGHIIKLLLQIIITTCFILIDHILYLSLHLVAKHAQIDYYQEGEHIVNIQVNGTGIIAGIIRSTIERFNGVEKIQSYASNKECLPRPHRISIWEYIQIYGIFLIIIIQIYNEPYIERLRSIICGYFYGKREKARILYLYNKLLRNRKRLYKLMTQTINERISSTNQKYEFNFIIKLIYWYPKYCGWLRIFPFARRKCILCNEIEPMRKISVFDMETKQNQFNNQFIDCTSDNCKIIHCRECWHEIKQVCFGCSAIWEQFYDTTTDKYHYNKYDCTINYDDDTSHNSE